jgi:LPS export ABC transporter protein LptC
MYSHIERRRTRPAGLKTSRWLAGLSFLIALSLIGLLVFQAGSFPTLLPELPAAVEEAPSAEPKITAQTEKLTVSESRFTGFDRARQPFSVTARHAVQDGADKNKVRLADVAAQLKRKSGDDIAIRSQRALYNSSGKMIDLDGNVTIVSADGFVAKMAKAQVNIEEHRLYSDVPVEVVYDRGVIRSNGMEIIDDGARILFFNGVKATFGGESSKGSVQ